jgi:hypothetical protein
MPFTIALEQAGIDYFIKDLHTSTAIGLGSAATGGIKLIVDENDAHRALQLLVDEGLLPRESLDQKAEPGRLVAFLSLVLPYLNKVFLVIIITGLIALLWSLFDNRSEMEILCDGPAKCLESLDLKSDRRWSLLDSLYAAQDTSKASLLMNIYCENSMDFAFPDQFILKLGPYSCSGRWYFEDDQLRLMLSTRDSLLFGTNYSIKDSANLIILSADSTKIYLYD